MWDISIMRFINILLLLPFVFGIHEEFYEFVDNASNYSIQQIPLEKGEFPCHTGSEYRSKDRPLNVNKLKVGDIDVVAAIGDSLTAGFAAEAETLLEIFTESRGVSWSIGGRDSWEEGIRTFPNIVKKYNPKLKGMSINSTNARHPSEIQGYNAAVTGSIAKDVPNQGDTTASFTRR